MNALEEEAAVHASFKVRTKGYKKKLKYTNTNQYTDSYEYCLSSCYAVCILAGSTNQIALINQIAIIEIGKVQSRT